MGEEQRGEEGGAGGKEKVGREGEDSVPDIAEQIQLLTESQEMLGPISHQLAV